MVDEVSRPTKVCTHLAFDYQCKYRFLANSALRLPINVKTPFPEDHNLTLPEKGQINTLKSVGCFQKR